LSGTRGDRVGQDLERAPSGESVSRASAEPRADAVGLGRRRSCRAASADCGDQRTEGAEQEDRAGAGQREPMAGQGRGGCAPRRGRSATTGLAGARTPQVGGERREAVA
jgi:hypothetical protein